ncbi:unnamed protein product [Adineta ricciae]|uniref:Uncharacterized protein n=1 Tax=Adineta ricciae TaxID=249248 RepID=A0A815GIP4_ADIRI|nr:unnamed protein product [Adineta ricciae]CAF1628684.1 unnamed protein product [Adineta ricciae]
MFGGFITNGGMTGHDMNALSQGLDENTEFSYLKIRIKQIEYLGKRLTKFGIPVQMPYGCHAIFVDARKCLLDIRKEQYSANALALLRQVDVMDRKHSIQCGFTIT